mgnify:CR=1 FL=1
MAIDNKTIETNKEAKFFVLIVKRDGVEKFIDKKWYTKGHINCTVIISKAKRFSSKELASKFYEILDNRYSDMSFIAVVPLKIEYSIPVKAL